MQKVKNQTITPGAFHRLLEWLDNGENSDGLSYLTMQRRLVAYFDRKNCPSPEELTDETLNRVARRLEEEGAIECETPARYCYITARFVFMEYLRGASVKTVPLEEVRLKPHETGQLASLAEAEERAAREKLLDCLEGCTNRLEPVSRDIIISYYYGTERIKIEGRRALAQRLGITSNALSIRACRIRDKLEACIGKCLAAD